MEANSVEYNGFFQFENRMNFGPNDENSKQVKLFTKYAIAVARTILNLLIDGCQNYMQITTYYFAVVQNILDFLYLSFHSILNKLKRCDNQYEIP